MYSYRLYAAFLVRTILPIEEPRKRAWYGMSANTNDYLGEMTSAIYRNFNTSNCIEAHPGVLSELIEVKYGKDHKKLEKGDIPVYGSGGLVRKVNRGLYEGESVLIPRKGSLNNVMFVNSKFWTVDTMFYSIPKCPGAAKYVYEFLKTQNLASMNSGSAVPSMTTVILDALPVKVPSERALRILDSRLQPIYALHQFNSVDSKILAELRDALLPKLMSGEIDVSQLDLTQLNNHLRRFVAVDSAAQIANWHLSQGHRLFFAA